MLFIVCNCNCNVLVLYSVHLNFNCVTMSLRKMAIELLQRSRVIAREKASIAKSKRERSVRDNLVLRPSDQIDGTKLSCFERDWQN